MEICYLHFLVPRSNLYMHFASLDLASLSSVLVVSSVLLVLKLKGSSPMPFVKLFVPSLSVFTELFFLYSVFALLKNSVQLKLSGESIGEGLVRMNRFRAMRKMT